MSTKITNVGYGMGNFFFFGKNHTLELLFAEVNDYLDRHAAKVDFIIGYNLKI